MTLKIGITGATGFIGRRIAELAAERGHEVIAFSRSAPSIRSSDARLRPFRLDEPIDLSGCDALIHLAGESVFGLWTEEKKRRIRGSRTRGTRHLVDAILASERPPPVLVSGSAIGFYGDTGETIVDEDSPPGTGFLAEVTQAWEAEALRAQDRGVRVVLLRTSVVLGKQGGALEKMVPIFRRGLGGRLGSGRQWMSWIHIDDIAELAFFAVENERVAGPLNGCAPEPVRNNAFTKSLARALHRPALFPAPKFVLKSLLGEFSHELLDSKRIVPARTLACGFAHRFSNLDDALASVVLA